MYGCVIKIAPYTLGGTPAEDNRVSIISGGLYNELLARNFEPDEADPSLYTGVQFNIVITFSDEILIDEDILSPSHLILKDLKTRIKAVLTAGGQ